MSSIGGLIYGSLARLGIQAAATEAVGTGAAIGVGGLAIASIPYIIGAAAVASLGYTIYELSWTREKKGNEYKSLILKD